MASGDILIVAAVSGELEGLTQHLSGTTSELVGGREIVRGRISRQAVRLLVSGPGMANTVQSLTAAVEKKTAGSDPANRLRGWFQRSRHSDWGCGDCIIGN